MNLSVHSNLTLQWSLRCRMASIFAVWLGACFQVIRFVTSLRPMQVITSSVAATESGSTEQSIKAAYKQGKWSFSGNVQDSGKVLLLNIWRFAYLCLPPVWCSRPRIRFLRCLFAQPSHCVQVILSAGYVGLTPGLALTVTGTYPTLTTTSKVCILFCAFWALVLVLGLSEAAIMTPLMQTTVATPDLASSTCAHNMMLSCCTAQGCSSSFGTPSHSASMSLTSLSCGS